MIDKKTFGFRLKDRRMACGLTQPMLADKAGISNWNRLSNWELGYAFPPLNILCRLADALNCSVDHLLGMDEYNLTQDELQILQMYRRGNDARKALVRAVLESPPLDG